eukprot:SAG11_NODE_171_length_13596_cov_15.767356_6_plen_62_part_00
MLGDAGWSFLLLAFLSLLEMRKPLAFFVEPPASSFSSADVTDESDETDDRSAPSRPCIENP